MTSIPIRNLYVMLAYACREQGLLDDRAVGACNFERPLDLVGRLLDAALRRLHRRGLQREYRTLAEQGAFPRGSLSIARTISQLLHVRGELAWHVDDLVPDTECNRVLKSAVRSLLVKQEAVETGVRKRLRCHLALLAGVQDIPVRAALNLRPIAPRTIPAYKSALLLSRLALEHLLPDTGASGHYWQALLRDPDRLGELFESFVRGFAMYEFRDVAHVCVRHPSWNAEAMEGSDPSLLPQLRTDVSIEWHTGERTICECKFYEKPLVRSQHSSTFKLRAPHLHQLLAYLRATEAPEGRRPEGLLLYATVGGQIEAHWRIDGYRIDVGSIGLDLPWEAIRADLLSSLGRRLSRPAQVEGR